MNRNALTLALISLLPSVLFSPALADEMGLLGVETDVSRKVPVASAAPGTPQVDPLEGADVKWHAITLVDRGRLKQAGTNATPEAHLEAILDRFTTMRSQGRVKGFVINIHGGLVKESWGYEEAEERMKRYLPLGYYPITIAWNTDQQTMKRQVNGNVIIDPEVLKRMVIAEKIRMVAATAILPLATLDIGPRPDGYSRWASTDRAVENVMKYAGGDLLWSKMQGNATDAVMNEAGGGYKLSALIAEAKKKDAGIEIHITAHSIGCLMASAMARMFDMEHDVRVDTLQLCAPAMRAQWLSPLIDSLDKNRIGHVAIYNLTTKAELADSYDGYEKSILYLVQNALELDGRKRGILGLNSVWTEKKWLRDERDRLAREGKLAYILSPNFASAGEAGAIGATSHGGMPKDETLLAALAKRITEPSSPRMAGALPQ